MVRKEISPKNSWRIVMCNYSTLKNELVVGFFSRLLAVLDPVVNAALRIGVLFFCQRDRKRSTRIFIDSREANSFNKDTLHNCPQQIISLHEPIALEE